MRKAQKCCGNCRFFVKSGEMSACLNQRLGARQTGFDELCYHHEELDDEEIVERIMAKLDKILRLLEEDGKCRD